MRDRGSVNPNAVKSVTQNPRICVKTGKDTLKVSADWFPGHTGDQDYTFWTM